MKDSIEQMTPTQRYLELLVLVLIAPDDNKAKEALDLADQFALGLSAAEVHDCKESVISVREFLIAEARRRKIEGDPVIRDGIKANVRQALRAFAFREDIARGFADGAS